MNAARMLDGIPPALWRLVSLERPRLLMLDYDGTMAPFQVARDRARASVGTVELLEKICRGGHTTVAIVSGRPVAELVDLLGPLPLAFVGEHGWEERRPDGSLTRHGMPRRTADALDRAEQFARSRGWASFMERKRSGLVLHTRGLPTREAAFLEGECLNLWLPGVLPDETALVRIDGGIELRAVGRDKGTTVLALLSRAEPGTLAVYVGDDLTDEDAFAAVQGLGFGVRVGEDDRPTLASGRLPSPAAVEAFLAEWLRIVETAVLSGKSRCD